MSKFQVSKTAVRLVSKDYASASDIQESFADVIDQDQTSRADRNLYALYSATVLPTLVDGGMTQTNLATSFGISTSYVSKAIKVGRLFADIAKGSSDDGSALERWGNLSTYWHHENGNHMSGDMFVAAMGDEGAARGEALQSIGATFGSLEYVYTIAEGKRFHADDPRSLKGDGDEPSGDEPTDDDDEPTPSVSGEELIARGVRKMRESGATDQAIADYFMAVIGNQ